MNVLNDLIERLKESSYHLREIDARIWAELDSRDVARAGSHLLAKARRAPHDQCLLGFFDVRGHFLPSKEHKPTIPHYTKSLDDALSLIPRGYEWQVSTCAPEPHAGRCYIRNSELINIGLGGMTPNPKYKGFETTAATPAIATCIVALLARLS